MSRRGNSEGGGASDWLPLIGGIVVGAGVLALVYKMFFSKDKQRCLQDRTATWSCPKEKPSPYYNVQSDHD
ncbi:hypothetical protein evm_012500 [Chilo suppressalis]|nr:hypothetical protein evm_012500 [Chilo suppressalis]